MKPVDGTLFVPRPGRMEQIDLPVVETAEAEGALLLGGENEKRPLAGIKIQLLDTSGRLCRTRHRPMTAISISRNWYRPLFGRHRSKRGPRRGV